MASAPAVPPTSDLVLEIEVAQGWTRIEPVAKALDVIAQTTVDPLAARALRGLALRLRFADITRTEPPTLPADLRVPEPGVSCV